MCSVLTRRQFNLATLLPFLAEACGGNAPPPPPSQALVSGGNFPDASIAQREIYVFDSGCGRFLEPPHLMTVPRTQHTASPITLSDGRNAVLLTGGTDYQNNVWSSWEIVLPDGSPLETGNMAVPRMGHTATRLADGKVLLCGGVTSITVQGRTTVATLTNTAEVFNPGDLSSTGTDAAGGTTMTTGRIGHTATLIDTGQNGGLAGWVLIAGGSDTGPTAELFDPNTKRFAGTATLGGTEMRVRRHFHQATWLPGINLVLITGGATDDTVLSATEIYNPGGGFLRIQDMNVPRVHHTATNIGLNVVLIAGGLSASHQDLRSAELWDPSAQTFTVAPHLAMTLPRANHSAVLLTTGPQAGDVLLAGGRPESASADLFHPTDQSFAATQNPVGNFGGYNNAATLMSPAATVQCQ